MISSGSLDGEIALTWSIVAKHPNGAYAVAVATRFFAVGALCPHAAGGVGALATQALINPLWGPDGLAMLRQGRSAEQTLRALVDSDRGRETRQLHVVDRHGQLAQHTGRDCVGWCGHRAGDGFSVAGNMLTGEGVVAATALRFAADRGTPLAERLINAMEAGEAQGGDKRGKQSAALIIHTTEDYPSLSLRVDDHADPLAELRRLLGVSRQRFEVFREFLATRANPAGTFDRAVIDAALARREAEASKPP